MNHSNKVEQSMAESEDGRPLIEENIRQPHTRPTQSGARASWALVKKKVNYVLDADIQSFFR